MNWFEALILGIVQGITEFLPVSSSGHLQIGAALFGTNASGNMSFAIVVHAATVLSTIVVFWKIIIKLFTGLFKFKWNSETEYTAKLAVSMIPVAIAGIFFKDKIEAIFGSGLLIVGICLFVTAILLTFSYYLKPRTKNSISFIDSFIIGTAQAIAVLPGLSRSGSTIATGLLLGNKKEDVAQFSFLMVLIPIIGEALLDLFKGEFTGSTPISTTALIVGFLSAFVSGLFACTVMLNIVKRGKLVWFAVYCVIAGTVAFIFS
ncbi:MAG: undecaprenyl-diphosphate phosphatase [Prevotellaceae bacterium]|jgi:undecaprenyl-diphosphatase|nr:undecaprenyl-diphosphate phosphatase [Prevotellaceae bacterium]